MKTLKSIKTILFFAFMTLVAIPLSGQQRPAPGQGQGPGRGMGGQWTEDDVKQRVERLSEALNLSEEQEKKILDFEMEQYKKNSVEMQKNRGDREKMREIMNTRREQRDVKYREVLTDDQFAKYKKNQEERMRSRPSQDRPQPQGTRTDRGRGR